MKKVLVVDDSPVVRNFHMSVLKKEGFFVDGASDGAEALEKALTEHFDLILCDINMANMDGLTFIQKYREEEKETPIIIISTQEDEFNKQKGFESGANFYLTKPVKPEKLILNISMLLNDQEK